MFPTTRFTFCLVLLQALVCPAETPSFHWPRVAPLRTIIRVDDVSRANVEVPIKSIKGDPLYRLQCKSGSGAEPDGFEFMVEFQCRLVQFKGGHSRDLLNEELYGGKDWIGSRGRLNAEGLYPETAKYPEIGAVRHFRLRGMILTLRFSRVLLNDDQTNAKSLTMSVEVDSDTQALSAIAEPSGIAVRRGKVVHTLREGEFPDGFLAERRLLPPYPEIVSSQEEFIMVSEFNFNPTNGLFSFGHSGDRTRRPELRFPIHARDGSVAYVLRCANMETGWTEQFTTQCRLTRPNERLDLLAGSRDPYSTRPTSIIHVEQLYGKCAEYPEYGSRRVFRLRRMKLVLNFERPVFQHPERLPYMVHLDRPGLERAVVRISVEPDDSATSPVAPTAQYVDPGLLPKGCEVPMIGARYEEESGPSHHTPSR